MLRAYIKKQNGEYLARAGVTVLHMMVRVYLTKVIFK